MKKILTLFLAICMLISIIPMAVSAETIKPAKNTVYVSTSKVFEGTADGSYDKPYKYFDDAYNTVTQDTTIVLLDDVALSESNTIRDFFLKNLANNPVVTVCGIWNGTRYTALDLTNTAEDTCVLTLGTNMVFYDVNIKLDTVDKNVWICAAYCDVTFGANFNNDDLIGGSLSFAGSNFGDETNTGLIPTGYNINSESDYVINLYSGNFNQFYLRERSVDCTASSGKCTFNYYGGVFNNGSTNKLVAVYSSGTSTGVDEINFYSIEQLNSRVYVEGVDSTKTRYKKLTINFYTGITEFKTGIFQSGLTEAKLLERVVAVNYYEAVDTTSSYVPVYAGVQNTEKYTATPENKEPYEAYSVRFVGVVNSLAYDEVGFKITCGERNFDTACKYVYTSIAGDGDDYTAAALGGNYIFAVAIKNIPTEGEVTFTVKPYFVVDNQTYYGTAYTVTYNAEGYVSSAVAN